MIGLSLLLVAGALAVIATNLGEGAELRFGYQQLIHGRVPWLLFSLLWGGCAVGVASIFRKRAIYKFPVVAVEVFLAVSVSWYLLVGTELPAHELSLKVGDAFPAYSLVDHDGRPALYDGNTAPGPALYIFYRGDW